MVEGTLSYRDRVSQLISWGHWFCLSNIIIALLISTRYLTIAHWPEGPLAQIFMLVSWIAQFSFLPFLIFLLILFPLSFLIPNRYVLRTVGSVIGTVGICALIIDTQIFASFHQHLNPLLWQLLLDKESNTLAADINLIFILVPLVLLLELLMARTCWKNLRRLEHKHIGKPISAIFIVCFFITHLVHVWADATVYRPITTQQVNFPLFYPMTAKSFLNSYGFIDIERYEEKANRRSDEDLSPLVYPNHDLQIDTQTESYNLLLVVVEGLRADMLNSEQMPHSWTFSEDASRFKSHFSGGNDPTMGLYSLFYGIPGSYWNSIRDAGIAPIFLHVLEQQHYQIHSFLSKDREYANMAKTVMIDQEESLSSQSDTGGSAGDQMAIEQWKEWQSNTDQSTPWFNFIYLNGVASFDNQDETDNRLPSPELILPVYQQAVQLADNKLDEIYQHLSEQGLLDSTIVIITSDHGQEFNEQGNQILGSGTNFSRYQAQVPLVIHWPGRNPAVIEYDTSHLDLTATLLPDLLNVKNRRSDYSSGESLFDRSRRSWILIGNQEDQAIYQPKQITLFGKAGEYEVRNRDYKRLKRKKADMQVLIEALHEMKRFYHTDG